MGRRAQIDSRTVNLTTAQPSADLVHLTYADKSDGGDRQFTLRVTVPQAATGNPAAAATVGVAVTVTEIAGGVPNVRGPFFLAGGAQRRFKSSADAVVVTVNLATPSGAGAPGGSTATVKGWLGLMPSGQGGDDFMWTPGQALHDVTGGQVFTGPCTVGSGHVTLKTGAGVPVWLLLFDSVGAPAANTPPIFLGTSDGMQNAGDGASLEDEFEPGTIVVQNGLYVALSSDPGGYVAAAAATGEIDIKVGL